MEINQNQEKDKFGIDARLYANLTHLRNLYEKRDEKDCCNQKW